MYDDAIPSLYTISFREALTEARRIQAHSKTGKEGLDARHFIAAYAIVPDYHLPDFLRLRIDLREWCLELAEE